MAASYSQLQALWAIARASLKAILRSPSAVVFSIAFPLIFILVFGFLGGGKQVVRFAFTPGSDTLNPIAAAMLQHPALKRMPLSSSMQIEELEKGRITAIVAISTLKDTVLPKYRIEIQSSTAAADKYGFFQSVINEIIIAVDKQQFPNRETLSAVQQLPMLSGRKYRTIDFILPGQLGFSLLSAGIFGVAFLFYNLRQTLVLKRFFATPVKKSTIVLGEGLARVIFQLLTAVVILLIGHFVFHFTLVNGVVTFIELLFLSFIGLIVFMGFGFVVSGLAPSESAIPPLANLVTMPQFILAGTFFSIDAFPSWLQPICKVLPLTHLNNAMRAVAFEGTPIWQLGFELGILAAWGIVVYLLAVRFFKWD